MPKIQGPYLALVLSLLFAGTGSRAQTPEPFYAGFNDEWIVNEELSDDTDYQVERSILEAGGRLPRTGKKGKGRYRGGPPEQALYDHMSYDDTLSFHYAPPEFRVVYDHGFERVFYSDNRKRVVSASGTAAGDDQDFSFATWDDDRLLVESRPRDGGWILETYELTGQGQQLQVSLELNPSSFAEPIYITRIYDRVSDREKPMEDAK